MGNLFFNLPLPAGNGPGAAVDVSSLGAPRTIECVGSFVGATIAIEASSDGGATFSPLTSFQNKGGEQVLPAVVQFVRTLVSGRKLTVPFSANVDIAANDGGSLFAVLPLPVQNGAGVAVDLSAFGNLTTVNVTGAFAGASVAVEISEDNLAWAPLVAFGGQGGIKTKDVTAAWARANVSGRKTAVPFGAVVAIGAADIVTQSASTIVVADEGVPLGSFTELDFVGAGVTATNAGGGIAQITVPGGSPTTRQVFRYTALGTELSQFPVALPAARASANYNVQLTSGGPQPSAFQQARALAATFAINTFDVELEVPPTLGDILMITVEDLT